MKEVIKIGGEWLSSLELEDVINLHPAVSEVAIIGVADDKWGEKPLALIVVKEDAVPPEAKEMAAHVKSFIDKGMMSKIPLWPRPRDAASPTTRSTRRSVCGCPRSAALR